MPHFSIWSYPSIVARSVALTAVAYCVTPDLYFIGLTAFILYYCLGSWLVLAYCPTPTRKSRTFRLPAYEHAPLRYPDSIRLLKLEKLRDGTIEFDLEQVRLSSAPPYEALSYVWGPTNNNRAIRCGARQLLVTDNCYKALDRLASRVVRRFLWIDALCIDQRELPGSVDERNRQVKMMGEIYRRALRVIVWLGESDDGSDVVFRYMQFKVTLWWLSSNLPHVGDWMDLLMLKIMRGKKNHIPRCCKSTSLSGSLANDTLIARGHDKLVWDFVQRPWFTRIWTIQEVALAGDADVDCAGRTLPVDLLAGALTHTMANLLRTRPNLHDSLTYSQIIGNVGFRHMLRNLVHQGKVMPDAPSFIRYPSIHAFNPAEFLGSTSICNASNPKDMVYGFFGILEALNIPLPKPDYSLSLGRIYWDFTVHLLKHNSCLNLLQSVSSDTAALRDAPTWVPNLQVGRGQYSQFFFGTDRTSSSSLNSEIGQNSATNKSTARFTLLENDQVLRVHGHVIDVIRSHSTRTIWPYQDFGLTDSAVAMSETGFRETISALREWFSLSQQDQTVIQHYGDVEKTRNAFCETLCQRMSCVVRDGKDFATWLRILQQEQHEHGIYDAVESTTSSAGRSGDSTSGTPRLEHLCDAEEIIAIALIGHADLQALLADPSRSSVVASPEWEILCALHMHPYTGIMQYIVSIMCRGRYFFTTEQGRMGMGPRYMREGDLVILVAGMDFPMVLRPVGEDAGRYTVVGPAFVTGVMDGELWRGSDESAVSAFELI